MIGKLYLVATPIGNLEDITLRAIRILKEADIIAAEDTRHTLKLLNHLEITKPLFSYHRHNENVKTQYLIEKLKEGQNIALVSDAGTPVISDPGQEVVKEALQNHIEVIPIPGACAAITALIASGIEAKQFLFKGFLSLNKKLRKKQLDEIEQTKETVIIYEAPHKLIATLEDLNEKVGDRQVVLARELTKMHEEYIRGTVKELLEKIESPKGEFVIVIEGKEEEEIDYSEISMEEQFDIYQDQGLDKKEIIKKIAKDRKLTKNEVYQYFLDKK